MLIGINPILTGDLLKVLSDMGHADEIVIADGNYSATADANSRPPIWVPSKDTVEVVRAILVHFPLDESYGTGRFIVEHKGDDPSVPATEFARTVNEVVKSDNHKAKEITREQFHRVARRAYAIVATTDPRHYACFILRKGALPEPD